MHLLFSQVIWHLRDNKNVVYYLHCHIFAQTTFYQVLYWISAATRLIVYMSLWNICTLWFHVAHVHFLNCVVCRNSGVSFHYISFHSLGLIWLELWENSCWGSNNQRYYKKKFNLCKKELKEKTTAVGEWFSPLSGQCASTDSAQWSSLH